MSEEKKKRADEAAEKSEQKTEKTKEIKAQLKQATEENEELKKELATEKSKSEDFKDKWYRVSAEFENFKKRNNEVRATSYANGKTDAVTKFLSFGDTVERALKLDLDDKTKEGVEMLNRKFVEILGSFGIEAINPENEVFDPNVHEAIFTQEPGEGDESGRIKSVYEKGYKLGDKIIRYAKVVVIK